MKSAVVFNSKFHIIIFLFALLMITATLPAHAYFYTGGDWGGRDLSLLDGDSLSGNFVNIGKFYIPNGASITDVSGNLSLSAGMIGIDGSLRGGALGYNLLLSAGTDLFMSGSLDNWKNITLKANTINLASTSSISAIGSTTPYTPGAGAGLSLYAGGTISTGDSGKSTISAPDGLILDSGGSIQVRGSEVITVTPIPAAAWLLGSGLLGLAGIRRRQG